jgi:uncharacterized surface protein with fasciclin (FAS1) repeats
MTYTQSLLKSALVAAPLAVIGCGAQAADVVGTLQDQPQFSTLSKAIESAGIAESLHGKGPYTIFAPIDQAFADLPPGAGDYLMQEANQDELKTLLQYHVVEGRQLAPDDVAGKQTKLDTVEGDSLSVDGTGQMLLLVPSGLVVTRVGDRVVVERQVRAMSAPALEVAPAGAGGQQGQEQGQTEVTAQGNMPATKHQEQVLRDRPQTEQRQTSAETEGAMPASPHQEQVLRDQPASEAGGQGQQPAQTEVTAQGNMPATKHQEQVLRDQPQTEQRQTSAETEGAMPSSPHQEQVLRGQQGGEQQAGGQQMAASGTDQQGQDQDVLREANVIGQPIQADNGVIYPIDAVLVPQKILSQLEK